jgi:hypothetical protein
MVLACVVVALTALAGYERLPRLDRPGLWLDEILAVLRAGASPLSTAWTSGPDPQHGPLYHGILALAGAVAPSDAAYRLPFALLGTLTVPVLFAFAAECAGAAAAILAAGLLAVSPMHVYLSREARPYALLLFLLALALLAASRQQSARRSRGWPILFAGSVAGLVLASSQGIWFALVPAVFLVGRRWKDRCVVATAVFSFAGASLLFLALYAPLLARSPDVGGAPAVTGRLVAGMFNALVTGLPERQPFTSEAAIVLSWAAAAAIALAWLRPGLAAALVASLTVAFAAPFVLLTVADHGIRGRYTGNRDQHESARSARHREPTPTSVFRQIRGVLRRPRPGPPPGDTRRGLGRIMTGWRARPLRPIQSGDGRAPSRRVPSLFVP